MQTYRHRIAGDIVTVRVPQTGADLDAFRRWFRAAERRGPIALDTETSGLDIYAPQFALRTVQFGDAHEAWVLHWERGGELRGAALWALRMRARLLIHNASFDWLVLDRHAGIPLEDLAPRTTDTRIHAALIDPRKWEEGGTGTGLKPLSARYIDPAAPDTQDGLTATFHSLGLTKDTGWSGIPLTNPTYNLYAGLDTILTARLAPLLRDELRRLEVRDRLVQYEHEIARICAHMQRAGLVVDQEYAVSLAARLGKEADKYRSVAAGYGVDKVGSPAQVAEALTAMGEVLTERTKGGALATGKKVLLPLADLDRDWQRIGAREPNPLADAVLRAKRAAKWGGDYAETFVQKLSDAGRIHASINPLQARTGRMSVSGPPLQQLPSGDHVIRRALLADEGHVMVSTDFEAIEMRVLAALADVRRMKSAILAGEDMHGFTARQVYGPDYTKAHRKLCKGIGFGKVYGGGTLGISRQTGAPVDDVQRAIDAYDRVYPEIRRTGSRWQREARANGMVHVSVTGRRLPLDRDRTYAVTNYACQSAARDLLGQTLLDMEEAGLLPYLRLPIHDEVLASAPAEEAADVAHAIEKRMTLNLYGVPIEAKADIGGRSWGSLYGAAY